MKLKAKGISNHLQLRANLARRARKVQPHRASKSLRSLPPQVFRQLLQNALPLIATRNPWVHRIVNSVCVYGGDLAALRNPRDDVVEFNVVGIVGLDVSSEAVEGTLDGFFRGRVHHAGLRHVKVRIYALGRNDEGWNIGNTHVLCSVIWGPGDERNFAPV